MELSVIISTYNSQEWLEKVLWGYTCQSFKDFELIIADDGSSASTSDLIKKIKLRIDFPLHHIWHEDKGFRKCEILNKAIVTAQTNYLVFSDGDCIPRKDFLQVHVEKRQRGAFLSGGAIRLPMVLSKKISEEDIISQKAFNKEWLIRHGLKRSFVKNLKLTKNKSTGEMMNKITPTKATWNGGNASAWKRDIIEVNGFDERMRYGAEDREFGERLTNKGLKGIQIRYSAVCIHLDHSRGYVNEADLQRNADIRRKTKKERPTWTPYGIDKRHKKG